MMCLIIVRRNHGLDWNGLTPSSAMNAFLSLALVIIQPRLMREMDHSAGAGI